MKDFIVIKKFIRDDICRQMSSQMFALEKSKSSSINPNDVQCLKSISFYNIFSNIHLLCLDKLEKAIGEELLPTYNYCRIYKKDEILEKHIDREACEISFTLTLDYHISPWVFWVQSDDKDVEILLNKGDICVYKGHEVPHWRNKMEHQMWQTQCFFHYVLKNGQHSIHKNDAIMRSTNAS